MSVVISLDKLIEWITSFNESNEYQHGKEKQDKLCNLGVGDTELIYNILSDNLAKTMFYKLKEEITWNTMRHRGDHNVPRLAANQGIIYSSNHEMEFEPIYRHPASEQPAMTAFTPCVEMIRQKCVNIVGHELNHALIQLYRTGNDHISEHSDKTIDVDRNCNILNYSAGAMRTMILKKKKETKSITEMDVYADNQRINLANNSLFVMGMRTNQYLYHSIRKDGRPDFHKNEDELAFNGQRISITFRKINTFKCRSPKEFKNVLIGQGAKKSNQDCIGNICNVQRNIIFDKAKVDWTRAKKDEVYKEWGHLLRVFGDENRMAGLFNWQKAYGNGFSVVPSEK